MEGAITYAKEQWRSWRFMRGRQMKNAWIIYLLGTILLLSAIADAQARGLYVRDRMNVHLRRSASERAQVIGMANINDYLEVKEEEGDWVKVVTPDGQEGWVASRLLTTDTPRALIIDQLNEKIKAYTDKLKVIQEQNKILEKDNRELKFQVSSLSSEVNKSKNDFTSLKDSSATYLDLRADFDKLVAEDKERIKKIDLLTKECSRLKTSERVKFTFVGGGFIVIGIILGGMLQTLRGKPKKSGYKM
jgi:SH3 domain protein